MEQEREAGRHCLRRQRKIPQDAFQSDEVSPTVHLRICMIAQHSSEGFRMQSPMTKARLPVDRLKCIGARGGNDFPFNGSIEQSHGIKSRHLAFEVDARCNRTSGSQSIGMNRQRHLRYRDFKATNGDGSLQFFWSSVDETTRSPNAGRQ